VLAAARKSLFDARAKRVRPHRDDKVLAGWNGLMISGLCAAGESAPAARAAEFIRTEMIKDGKLMRRWRGGEAAIDGLLEDYAYLVQGLLDLYEATFEPKWLTLATDLNDRCVALFYDESGGGFFASPAGRGDLIVRSKDTDDGAVPAGNSVAIFNLVRLSEIRSDEGLRKKAEASLKSLGAVIARAPHAFPALSMALDHFVGPSRQIVVAGDAPELTAILRSRFLPRTVIVRADAGVPLTEGKGDGPAVYICENFTCKAPVRDPAELRKILK
jgi:uncharacterized protein YyaL (SSP411 family)